MITGFLLVVLFWLLLFGMNIVTRWLMLRRHEARHDLVATLVLRREPETFSFLRLLFLALWVTVGVAAFTQDRALTLGVLGGFALIFVLMPLYLRSTTRSAEILHVDRLGLSIFPARTGLVHEGAFHIRIDWKDCFGYSVYRGNVLFSLLPSGYVEQGYGQERLKLEQVLNSLGIRKLLTYDVISVEEMDGHKLDQLEEQVEALARDVAAGYTGEFAALGIRLEVDRLLHEESGETEGAYTFVRVCLFQGEEVQQELEWLVWERYEDLLDVIALPEDRLYELIDDRIQAALEHRLREAGLGPRHTLLQ